MKRPPHDLDLDLAVRSWLREADEPTADRHRQIGRIMGRVDETRQRGGPATLPRLRWRAWTRTWVVSFGRVRHATPPLAAAVAVVVLVTALLLVAVLRSSEVTPAPGMKATPSLTPLPEDPADTALLQRLRELWSGEPVELGAARDVFAEDAEHTTSWFETVNRTVGPMAIAARAAASTGITPDGHTERVRALDGRGGEHRYVAVTGIEDYAMACVFWVDEERVTRQDCILPLAEGGSFPDLIEPDISTAGERAALQTAIVRAWDGDRDAFDAVIDPDIVHRVVWDNYAVTHEGREAYRTVAGAAPEALAPALDLPAPEGELRWTDFSDVGGGALCTFWARDGMIIRHDCVVPTSMGLPQVPVEPEDGPSASP